MARPRTRTATLPPERLSLLKEVFGGSLHAYRVLKPLGVSYPVFRRVWDGKEELPAVITAVEEALGIWTEALVRRLKSAA